MPGDSVLFTTVHSSLPDGVVFHHIIPEVLHDWSGFRILDAPLDAIDDFRHIAIGPFVWSTGKAPLLPDPFALEDKLDSFGITVCFAFIDRKHDIYAEAAVGGKGVVVLQDCLPGDTVGIQNCLDIVVFPDIAAPAVKLGEQYSVKFFGFDIFQELQHDRTL